jgi:hypothetical protein
MRKRPEVSIVVLGQDCGPRSPFRLSPEEADAIAEVFTVAAAAMRERKHGRVDFLDKDGEIMAEVGIDFGDPFDDDGGLPLIRNVVLRRSA